MRDEFSKIVKVVLADRVGHQCSNPDCRRPTSGPHEDPQKRVNIGVAAHITAASPGGARYNPDLTAKERRSIQNGIWLCQNCGKLVDSDERRFTVRLLRQWKKDAEENAQVRIEQPDSLYDFRVTPGLLQFLETLTIFIDESSQDEQSIEQYLLWLRSQDSICMTPELERIANLLTTNKDSGNTILTTLARRMSDARLFELADTTTTMATQIESLYQSLVQTEQHEAERHRLRVSARLLEIASRNLESSPFHVRLGHDFEDLSTGTLTFRWRVPDSAPNMMLVDLIGGVLENRISTILEPDGSIRLRIYDSLGRESSVRSSPQTSGSVLMIAVVWQERSVSLWIMGKRIGTKTLRSELKSPWTFLLGGFDIEEELSADSGIQGYEVDGHFGLNLTKNGLGRGGCLSDIAIFGKPLPPQVLREFASESDREIQSLRRNL
jgi:hypothetical protein